MRTSNAKFLPNDLMYEVLAGTELTRTEKAVLRMLARGMTLEDVARKRGVARETVKSQVRTARGRLGAKNTCHAIAIAMSLDLI